MHVIMFVDVMPCHAISCHVISCHVMPCHAMSCHSMSSHVISCQSMSCHVMACPVMSCHVMPCRRRLCSQVISFGCHVDKCNVRNRRFLGLRTVDFRTAKAAQRINYHCHYGMNKNMERSTLHDGNPVEPKYK